MVRLPRRRAASVVAALAILAIFPALVAAHPLGNFTINHYAGLRVALDRIDVDVVIDQAEIPTFQESTRIDTDGDGTVSAAELEAERVAACPRLASDLSLNVAGTAVPLVPVAAGLAFPTGASGAQTMRLVCEYAATLAAPLAASTRIEFRDHSWADRIGWREVTAVGDGTKLAGPVVAASVSKRLATYPSDLLSQPLSVSEVAFTAQPGGVTLEPFAAPDASPLAASGGSSSGASSAPVASAAPAAAAAAPAAVPGGVAGEISGLLGASDLTPLVILLSFLTAIALGAGHALTPGHGKTIMAAYLVGTRGTARHSLGLGLATAVSHTIGVLILATLILVAGAALPADRVYPILSLVSGVIVVVIGAWLLATQATRWIRASRRQTLTPFPAGAGNHTHPHDHPHSQDDASGRTHSHAAVTPTAASAYGGRFATTAATATGPGAADDGMHRHGWRVHSHVPADPAATSLSWRSLAALGLAGGLVPSTNALLILVATVAAGRAGYGIVLVVAFGIGMAAVLVGVGLALVYASGLVTRAPHSPALSRLFAFAPTVAALAVLVLGLYLTTQAIGGSTIL